jgi:hypothetical protein
VSSIAQSKVNSWAMPAVIMAILGVTAALPLAARSSWLLHRLVLVVLAVGVGGLLLRRIAAGPPAGADRNGRPGIRAAVEMVLYLSPVLLLTVSFPIAVSRISDVGVGGASLTTLLLASSLTVPWLSVAACLPIYRAIGDLLPASQEAPVRERLCQVWPTAFAQTAPAVLVFAAPVELALRWSIPALATYIALCLLHVAFAQSLILANISRNRLRWAAAWCAYAAALLLFPALWFLPPLAGLATQLPPMRYDLMRLRRLARLDPRDVAADVARGMLLGSVLWAHLLFFFLATDGHFAVSTVFFAVLPAVLAYNYYFVRLAPTFDTGVLTLRSAMESGAHSSMSETSGQLSAVVRQSLTRTALAGAAIGFVVTSLSALRGGSSVDLVAPVALAAWLFLMTTLVCYKLDYIGATSQAQLFSAAHLVICGAAFVLVPAGPQLYSWLVVCEAVLFAVALRTCLAQWKASEYSLFWRHATAW